MDHVHVFSLTCRSRIMVKVPSVNLTYLDLSLLHERMFAGHQNATINVDLHTQRIHRVLLLMIKCNLFIQLPIINCFLWKFQMKRRSTSYRFIFSPEITRHKFPCGTYKFCIPRQIQSLSTSVEFNSSSKAIFIFNRADLSVSDMDRIDEAVSPEQIKQYVSQHEDEPIFIYRNLVS